jgi:hypothetical protein
MQQVDLIELPSTRQRITIARRVASSRFILKVRLPGKEKHA